MMTPEQLKNSILQRAIEGKLVPCDLSKWKQVKLGDVVDFNLRNKIDDELKVSFIPMTMIADGYKSEFTFSIKKWKEIKKGYTHFADGDIAFAKITPCFQNRKSLIFSGLENGFGAGTTELVVLRPHKEVIGKYILWLVKSDNFIRNGVKSFKGTAGQQRIGKDFARNYEFMLPPLAEQKRIVAKLEELLPLVDEYAKAYNQLQSLNAKFPDDLKKSLLQYAMEGKLVPCDLSKWKQVKLGDVTSNHGQKKPDKVFNYIDIGSIDNTRQKLSETENLIEPSKAPSRARKIVCCGDILYATVRPYLHNMCIVDRQFSNDVIASTGFAVMACDDVVSNKFLFYYLLSPTFDNYANAIDNSKGVA